MYLKKIPKIAHCYWGNNTTPFLIYASITSFAQQNPDWTLNVYFPNKEITSINNPWKSQEHNYTIAAPDYFDCFYNSYYSNIVLHEMTKDKFAHFGISANMHEVHKSDILRWKLLCDSGGFWIDSDILFFKPMKQMCINNSDASVLPCISIGLFKNVKFHTIGFMGSEGNGNKYFYFIWKKCLDSLNNKKYQSFGADLLNKFFPTPESIEKQFNLKTLNIPFDILYSYYPFKYIPEMFKENGINRITQNSIGIHWYAGHESAANYINNITHKNFHHYKNSPVGKILNEIMLGRLRWI